MGLCFIFFTFQLAVVLNEEAYLSQKLIALDEDDNCKRDSHMLVKFSVTIVHRVRINTLQINARPMVKDQGQRIY